jgi:hypothetical protein
MSGAVEGVDINEVIRRVEYDMRHRAMLGSGGFVGERAEVEVIISALRASLTTPPARSYADAIEDAAKACEDQQQAFLSPQYATGQPLSSFHERFACGQCAAAIRLLSQGGKA